MQGRLRADNGECLLQAAIAGMGIIYIPEFMVQDEIKKRLLLKIFNPSGKNDQLMAFYTKHVYKPKKIDVFLKFLQRHLNPPTIKANS